MVQIICYKKHCCYSNVGYVLTEGNGAEIWHRIYISLVTIHMVIQIKAVFPAATCIFVLKFTMYELIILLCCTFE